MELVVRRSDTAFKERLTQQPVDITLWCICEMCGLRIHPLYRKRSKAGNTKTTIF